MPSDGEILDRVRQAFAAWPGPESWDPAGFLNPAAFLYYFPALARPGA